jgi:hypothetical protein
MDGALTFDMNAIVLSGIEHSLRPGQAARVKWAFQGPRRANRATGFWWHRAAWPVRQARSMPSADQAARGQPRGHP